MMDSNSNRYLTDIHGYSTTDIENIWYSDIRISTGEQTRIFEYQDFVKE